MVLYGVAATTEVVMEVHTPLMRAKPALQVQVGGLVAPFVQLVAVKAAVMVWLAVTFEKVYEVAGGARAPSMVSEATA